MKLRAAVAAATLVAPFAVALTGPAAPSYAVTMCQGKPATIEGSAGIITGTEGDDVIVGHGTDPEIQALGGNDLVCTEGGDVYTGPGDDSVVSTAPAGTFNYIVLLGGNDTYTSRAGGSSDVSVYAISSFHVVLGGGGTLQLITPTVPGTGTVEFGSAGSHLYAFGERRTKVDLSAQTVSVDGLLEVTMSGLRYATATGCKVRMKGDDKNNDLDAYGHDVVLTGGDGRDLLRRVGNGFDVELPKCGGYKSVFRGQGGPDRMVGRAGPDVMVGGPGPDVADGAGGIDTCRAEVRKSCER